MDSCHESLRMKSQEFMMMETQNRQGENFIRGEFNQELQRGGWISAGFSLLPVGVGQSLHPFHIPQEICVSSLYDSAGKQKC